MARARNIKPSFFQNEALGELDPLIRLFFIGLWTVSDYKGCLEYRPKRLKVQLLPYDEFDIEKAVKNLSENGFIRSYVNGQNEYIKIINFERHQSPHKNEREQGSDIPDFVETQSQPLEKIEDTEKTEKIGIKTEKNGTARADSFFPLPDLLNPDSPTPHTVPVRANKSKFSLDDCVRYAKTQPGITNPNGWAIKHHRTGESDAFILAALYPERLKEVNEEKYGAPRQFSTDICTNCFGAKMANQNGKGYSHCRHCQNEKGVSTGFEPFQVVDDTNRLEILKTLQEAHTMGDLESYRKFYAEDDWKSLMQDLGEKFEVAK